MPNILFIGFPEEEAETVIGCLVAMHPNDMVDAVYKAYPNDAPVYAVSKKPAPYIIIRDSDHDQAVRIKDAIQKDIDHTDGPPDVEIDIIQFYEGSGKIPEDLTDR